jgi:hypothetical protein
MANGLSGPPVPTPPVGGIAVTPRMGPVGLPHIPRLGGRMAKMTRGPRLGPKMPSKRVGGIRTNFTQGIATPKMSK